MQASGWIDEDNLLKECLSGNTRAQKQLYDRYSRKMYGVCLRYAPDQAMAEDFLQEGFIRIFMKLKSFRSQGSLEGWMRRIMVNTTLEILRKKDIFRNSIELTTANVQIGAKDEPGLADQDQDEPDILHFSAETLNKAFSDMPQGFRTVFNLYVVDQYTHKEIGALLGVSEGTSKSQYARARAWLQRRLTETKKVSNAGK